MAGPVADAWTTIAPYAERLAVWRGYEAELTTLTILSVGIALYTLLVFGFFCEVLSRRQPFHSSWGKGTWWGKSLAALESVFVFPVTTFAFFGVLAASLFFLAKPATTTYQILLFSIAIVTAVRLTAAVREGAASDLAKLLPLSLLGVIIIDPSYSTWDAVWARYRELPSLAPVLGRFFLLFLVLESGLRLGRLAYDRAHAALRRRKAAGEPEPMEAMDGVHMDAPVTTLEVVEGDAPNAAKPL